MKLRDGGKIGSVFLSLLSLRSLACLLVLAATNNINSTYVSLCNYTCTSLSSLLSLVPFRSALSALSGPPTPNWISGNQEKGSGTHSDPLIQGCPGVGDRNGDDDHQLWPVSWRQKPQCEPLGSIRSCRPGQIVDPRGPPAGRAEGHLR